MQLDFLQFDLALQNWRFGSGWAERMASQYLALQGYIDICPQAPLGGPDGGRDILFTGHTGLGVAACYFPTEPRSFTKIKKKFNDDWINASKHGPDKFYFITGQRLTPFESEELRRIPTVETAIIDTDALTVHINNLAWFVDDSARPKLNDAKRASDVSCLVQIINNCHFYEVPCFTNMAPMRFGPGIFEAEQLNPLFYSGQICFNDPLLGSLVWGWWGAWCDLLAYAGSAYFLTSDGGLHYPTAIHYPSAGGRVISVYEHAQMTAYLDEINEKSDSLRGNHASLLQYIQEFYTDALPIFLSPAVQVQAMIT